MVIQSEKKPNNSTEKSDNIVGTFYNPKSVAIVGASMNKMKNGNHIVLNLTKNKYNGKIYPINPNYKETDEVYGHKFKKSILEIDDEIDIAILYVANKLIPQIIKDCITKKVKGLIIQAAGFEEVGEEGLKLRDEIKEITENFTLIRIVGPNCMGLSRIDGDSDNEEEKGGFFCGFGVMDGYKKGNIGLITQSGMLNSGYLRQLWFRYPDMGFRYASSIGNKMDIGENEFLEFYLDDPDVNVIVLYLESFKNPRKFIKLAKRAKKMPNKSIVLLKGGSTSQGQKASKSHTGALAENERLIDAIITQAGVIKSNSFHELFQFARTLAMMYKGGYNWPVKGKIASIISSGGMGTLIADLTYKYGLTFPELSKEAYSKFEKIFPPWMPPNKFALLDIFPAMEYNRKNFKPPKDGEDHHHHTGYQNFYDVFMETLMTDPNIEGMIQVWFGGHDRPIEPILKWIDRYKKPFFYVLLGSPIEVQKTSVLLGQHNIPSFINTENLVKNFSILVREAQNKNL